MAGMAEQSYGTWVDWLLCLAAIIFMQTPSWHSPRWHKKHPVTQRPEPKPVSTENPQKDNSIWHRVLDFVEQPLFTTPAGIVGGIVGAFFYTPICLVCDACVLLALHRSKAVADQDRKTQIFIYILLFVVTTVGLIGVAHFVQNAARAYVADLVNQVIVGVRSDMRPKAPAAVQTAPPKSDTADLSVGEQFERDVDSRETTLWPDDTANKRTSVKIQLEPATYEDDRVRSRVDAVEVGFDNDSNNNDYDVSIEIIFFPLPGLGPKPVTKDVQCDKSNRVQILNGGHGGTMVQFLAHELIPKEHHTCKVWFMHNVENISTVTEWKKMFGTPKARSRRYGVFDSDIFRVRVGTKAAPPPNNAARYTRAITFERADTPPVTIWAFFFDKPRGD
jgi:hypothetical protein